ncbi:hypothetical protein NQ317_009364 [Molorchus minor]|uniref:Sodium/bile acid cotransporter 7 n=1 Tax=Molorchus minor TaxID=1323400 RepID=A0ABQ9JQM1_9CUCU|nr:hypothetical protein NQ317_009364 [Molorchus minor]
MRQRITPLDFLRKNWLLVGILCCIFLAGIYPKFGSKAGPLHTEYSVKYGAVFIIFLISGLSLNTDSIFHTFQQLVTVACMPPPVSSAIILTRAAQGNETAAIVNSVLGSFLGIIVTPLLLLLNLGSTTIVPILGTVIQLTITVLMPLLIGQALKQFSNFKRHAMLLNTVSQCALLFVIYTTFCDTFLVPETGLSALDVLFTIFSAIGIVLVSVFLLQITLLVISFKISRYPKRLFSPPDIIAAVFCSTHKSLTLGIPILRIMFHGYAHLSQISLPLLVYHPTQIILGGLIVSRLKDWVHSQKSQKTSL